MFESDEGRTTLRRNLMTRKALDRLLQIATQDGGAAMPTAEQELPARAKKPRKAEKGVEPVEDAPDAAEPSE
jgi:hypothetical protein